jgi:uncharacterized protein (PEP-CTERM system associated)
VRALSVPVVLSSLVLGSWLPRAAAQAATLGAPPAQDAQAPAASQDAPPGTIPQPTPDNPGVVAGVTAGELYTDNLKLAAKDQPKDTSWVTTVQPFVRAAVGRQRFSGWADYQLNGYVYTGGGTSTQVAQQLNAQGTLVALPQHLFVDGLVSYGRAIINNQLPSGSGTYFLSGNQANVASGTLSPYWLQDLGRLGSFSARYSLGRVTYDRRGIRDQGADSLSGIPDFTSQAVQLALVSPKFETWGWNAQYSQQRIEPDRGQALRFGNAKVGISRQISLNGRVLADVGKEDKYLPDGTIKAMGAWLWDVGVEWSTARDSFSLMGGHRFFGHSANLSWTHNAALLTTVVSYVEQPTSLGQQLLGQTGAPLVPPTNLGGLGGFGGLGGIGSGADGLGQIPSLANRQIYLMKRATASATYQMPRSNLTLTLYNESRDYFLFGSGREKVANAGLSWLWNLGPYTTFTPSFGWQRYKFVDQSVQYTRFGQLNLTHQINAGNFASLKLINNARSAFNAAPAAHDYRVNVVYFQWTHLF